MTHLMFASICLVIDIACVVMTGYMVFPMLARERRERKAEAKYWAKVGEDNRRYAAEQCARVIAKKEAKERKAVSDAARWEWILQQRAAAAERKALASIS